MSEYHKSAGCNFWQPQGTHSTGKFGIGTPPKNKTLTDTLPITHGPRPDRWSAHPGRNVWKEINSIFFGLNSCSNTLKPFDATFGSRRGAILQQNSKTAHCPKIKVSLTRYQLGVGLDPIYGVHTLAGMWKKNKFQFFFSDSIRLQMPLNSWIQLLAATGVPFYGKIRNRHTAQK